MDFLKGFARSAVALLMLGVLAVTAVQAAPTSLPIPQRIQITMEVVDVSPSVMDKLDRTIPEGNKKATLTWKALLKDQMPDVVEVSLQTPNDFPGVATYTKTVGFTGNAYPGKNFVTLITSLEVTPHLEKNEIIGLKLKTLVMEESAAGLPNTIGRGMTLPLIHVKNGEALILRGRTLDRFGKPAKPTDSQALEQVTFIAAVVLPASNEAAAAAGKVASPTF